MSGVFKTVGKIAGILAVVLVPISPVAASIAAVVAAVASIGYSLTVKPPPARGSVAQVLIAPDAPQPYAMGEGLVGGVLRHDTAYGATLNKVPHPYRFMAVVYSGGGPVQSLTPYVDQAAVSSWYSTFLFTETKPGAVPEGAALVPQFAGAPGWGAASKLSGKAAIGWSLKFDKTGKRFASGVPQLAAHGQWVKVYDPRADSTFPGGSGAQRLNNEATWAWSENPALHAGTYVYGRYQNGKRVFGVGLPAEAIDWAGIAAWANVCAANAWALFGVVFEPGDRWANLKDIAIAGGAVPVFSGGVLGFHYAAPRVALGTATNADLAEDEASITSMASWRDRINGVVPKYRSPAHRWEMVDAEKVTVPAYVTEDGEDKTEVFPFNLVKNKDQAARLAAYRLVDGRELQPITISYGPRLFAYRPGDCLQLVHPEFGLNTPAVILKREFDPEKMVVRLTFAGETAAKHAYALGLTGVAPPTPALGQSGQERDQLSAAADDPSPLDAMLIASSFTQDADPLDGLLQSAVPGTSLVIETHTRVYTDKSVSVTGATLTFEDNGSTAIVASTVYNIYYDDAARAGGAVALKATKVATTAANSPTNPSRHYVGTITSAPASGSNTQSGGAFPGGWDFTNWYF